MGPDRMRSGRDGGATSAFFEWSRPRKIFKTHRLINDGPETPPSTGVTNSSFGAQWHRAADVNSNTQRGGKITVILKLSKSKQKKITDNILDMLETLLSEILWSRYGNAIPGDPDTHTHGAKTWPETDNW